MPPDWLIKIGSNNGINLEMYCDTFFHGGLSIMDLKKIILDQTNKEKWLNRFGLK